MGDSDLVQVKQFYLDHLLGFDPYFWVKEMKVEKSKIKTFSYLIENKVTKENITLKKSLFFLFNLNSKNFRSRTNSFICQINYKNCASKHANLGVAFGSPLPFKNIISVLYKLLCISFGACFVQYIKLL